MRLVRYPGSISLGMITLLLMFACSADDDDHTVRPICQDATPADCRTEFEAQFDEPVRSPALDERTWTVIGGTSESIQDKVIVVVTFQKGEALPLELRVTSPDEREFDTQQRTPSGLEFAIGRSEGEIMGLFAKDSSTSYIVVRNATLGEGAFPEDAARELLASLQ